MIALAFLQNAWSPLYAGTKWPRHLWLPALNRSRSGQRLRVLETACPSVDLYYENTTPIVGETPDSVVQPDLRYIQRNLVWVKPDVVIALGKQAEEVLWHNVNVPLLVLPHPACRYLTNRLYTHAGLLLETGKLKEVWRLVITQEKGHLRYRSS